MAAPASPLGLDVLDGVHFDAGPNLVYQVTGASSFDLATGTITISTTGAAPGTNAFAGVTTFGLDVPSPNAPVHSLGGITYGYNKTPGFFTTFAQMVFNVGGLGYGNAYIIGFADNALLFTVGPTAPSALPDGVFYILNLSYSSLALIPPTPITAPLTFTANPADTGIFTPACFAEGARVLTRRGEVAVEALAPGDEVATLSGGFRPVIWIGSRQVRPDAYPTPETVHPVRVRAGAFGDGAPVRDLRLSPGHAVHVDGTLVPVGLLVNGATIVREPVEQVRYFHVELDAHDVLLAEGLPCESYLDDGNRAVFANSPEHVDLHGRLDPIDREGACAPVLRGREADLEALAAIKAGLHARARALGWRVEAGSVSLLADGVVIEPMHVVGERLWFQVPAAGEVALASISGRPCELFPQSMDRRRLGAAVSEVRLDGRALDLDGEAFGDGFLAVEQHGQDRWRWTDGLGRLAIQGPALLEVTLHAPAAAWTRPAPTLRLVQAG